MQALGAYANLGLNKGKVSFLKHIGSGLESLYMALENTEQLPNLKGFIDIVRNKHNS